MSDNKAIRFRFAPSPTGFLHIGNLRSALFGYLLAKSQGGQFILRIEDTDQKREVEGAIESLISICTWMGIEFDEGPKTGGDYGPYIQTERLDIYQKQAEVLLTEGKAYRCFCSEERLTNMRNEQEAKKLPPRYDRLCLNLSKEEVEAKIAAGESYVIRQKMPLEGDVFVHDELRGDIKFPAGDLDDHVLIKSNGIPTYQFASVVDDHLMNISHVTRGDEWLPSFPKNILLYQAFGWTPPKFIHFPLILNKTGGKLSKRQGDVFVEQYRDKGYLPEAILNFCVLLGWHPKGDKEILIMDEVKKEFSVSDLGSSPAVFDPEKLDYLNGYYIRQKSVTELIELCRPYLEVTPTKLEKYVVLAQERMKKLEDIKELSAPLLSLSDYEVKLLLWKELTAEIVLANLTELSSKLSSLTESNWQITELETEIIAWIKERGGKNGDYLWPLRVALSGLKNSPSPFELAWALGKEETLARLQIAIKKIK